MTHSVKIVNAITGFLLIISVYSCLESKHIQATSNNTSQSNQSDFIASISQVWADTVNPQRKVVLANIITSDRFIGTDERYGEEGIINLEGITKNFELNWTVMIKKKQENFPKKYIAYKGVLTDTTSNNKRMIAYSALDTLYLKALPPAVIKTQAK
ncbi:MAG: hypothetical protein ABI723_07635 [Bacteroidia bacterium]